MNDHIKSIKIGSNPSISVDYSGEGEMIVFLHGIGGNKKIGTRILNSSQKNFYPLHGILVVTVKVTIILGV